MKNAFVKRAIITGGTGGLGKALNSIFHSAGWEVICLSRKDLDLQDKDAVEDEIRQARARGRLDRAWMNDALEIRR